ncbi:MAG: hypothetical protein FWE71_14470 [Nocardioidaceae bacterium]|nr:hypothetical protein [Nocardioidaceae bacterium]MCL2614063.1 hypothetical protein [Nocardioidaceae bacterium]
MRTLATRAAAVAATALLAIIPTSTVAHATAGPATHARAAARYTVSMSTLCKSFHVRTSGLVCAGGSAVSRGTYVKYQAHMDPGDDTNVVYLKAASTSCSSITISFWATGTAGDITWTTRVTSVAGTKTVKTSGSSIGTVTQSLKNGPMRVSVANNQVFNKTHYYVYGSATCSTRNGLR